MMEHSPLKRILLVSLVLFTGYLLFRHFTTSEEDRIRRVFNTIETGLEQKKPLRVMSAISNDYRDTSGRTYSDIQGLLLIFNRVASDVKLSLGPRDINVKENTASLKLNVTARIKYGEQQAFQTEDGSNLVLAEMKKENGRWLLSGATYPESIENWMKRLTSF